MDKSNIIEFEKARLHKKDQQGIPMASIPAYDARSNAALHIQQAKLFMRQMVHDEGTELVIEALDDIIMYLQD